MKENKEKDKQKIKYHFWLIKILLLAIFLSLSFSLLSELALNKTTIIVAVVVIFVFIIISVVFDMIGLAVAYSDEEAFTAMASRKVRGAKQAISLIRNADKVSSICNDVIGDVCGILSGAAGASIVVKIISSSSGSFMEIFIPSLISAIIAGLTIFGKAVFKNLAIKNCNKITLGFAKFLNFFTRKD